MLTDVKISFWTKQLDSVVDYFQEVHFTKVFENDTLSRWLTQDILKFPFFILQITYNIFFILSAVDLDLHRFNIK